MNEFSIVPWSTSFETGISDIDEQHKRLVALLNEVATLYVGNAPAERIKGVLDELRDYTVYHFETEEGLWRSVMPEDPWTTSHEATHKAFVDRVKEIQSQWGLEPPTGLIDDTLAFLTRWLAHHILYEDRRMASAYLAHARGAGLEQAKLLSREAMSGQTSALIQTVLSMYELLSTRTLALERETQARLRAEEALRQSESDWRTILGSARDGIWDWNLAPLTLNVTGEGPSASFQTLLQDSLEGQTIHPDDWPAMRDELIDHFVGRSVAFNNQHRVMRNDGTVAWVLSRGKVVRRDEQGRPLRMVGTHTDITERKTVELMLRSKVEAGAIVSETAAAFMGATAETCDAVTQQALSRVGQFVGADRCYVFEISKNGAFVSNTHEWCAKGISSTMGQLRDVPFARTPWWWHQLNTQGRVMVEDVDALPDEAAAERALLQEQGTRCVYALPLKLEDRIIGFIGFDSVRVKREWDAATQRFLGVMGRVLALALNNLRVMQALNESESGFRHLFESLGDAIIVTDQDTGVIVDVNHQAETLTGLSKDQLRGLVLADLMALDDSQAPLHYSNSTSPQGLPLMEVAIQNADGRRIPVEVSTAGDYEFGEKQLAIGVFRDITERKQHQRELERLAYYDALTDLPNRRLLSEMIEREMSEAKRTGRGFVVAYLGLDNFKNINDQLGPSVADQVLVLLAHRLRLQVDGKGGLSRVSGDEFAMVLSGVETTETGMARLLRLLYVVADPMSIDGHKVSITASIGVTAYPQETGATGERLIRQAQQAMFQAKQEGRNRYHVYDVKSEQAHQELNEQLQEVELALAAEQFELYYQPKVNMRTGEVIGLEALIRWPHAERGLIPPGVFLPLLKDHPLDIALGQWVIQRAVKQLHEWAGQGLDISIGVNVGGEQLLEPNFTLWLSDLLARYPTVNPSRLQIEVLESSAMDDILQVSDIMHQCRKLGVTFALDDFGTGFSSLTYLKHLPATMLKVDQGFVRDMLSNTDDLTIINGVLGMSKAFGLQVIAEGVETEEHGCLLIQLGCELGQGYGIARPMPVDRVPGWISSWEPPLSWREQRPVDQKDLPLLYASVEHRLWFRSVEQLLKGQSKEAPQMDPHRCRFGHWLEGDGKGRYKHHPDFSRLYQNHMSIHDMARHLVGLSTSGHPGDAVKGLESLRDARDRLLEDLKTLLD